MRAAKITTRHERGVDEDAGRHRITFLYGRRQLAALQLDEFAVAIDG